MCIYIYREREIHTHLCAVSEPLPEPPPRPADAAALRGGALKLRPPSLGVGDRIEETVDCRRRYCYYDDDYYQYY